MTPTIPPTAPKIRVRISFRDGEKPEIVRTKNVLIIIIIKNINRPQSIPIKSPFFLRFLADIKPPAYAPAQRAAEEMTDIILSVTSILVIIKANARIKIIITANPDNAENAVLVKTEILLFVNRLLLDISLSPIIYINFLKSVVSILNYIL